MFQIDIRSLSTNEPSKVSYVSLKNRKQEVFKGHEASFENFKSCPIKTLPIAGK